MKKILLVAGLLTIIASIFAEVFPQAEYRAVRAPGRTPVADITSVLQYQEKDTVEDHSADEATIKIDYPYCAEFNADAYFIDTIKLYNPILITEKKTWFDFIKNFDTYPKTLELGKTANELFNDGWAIFIDMCPSAPTEYIGLSSLFLSLRSDHLIDLFGGLEVFKEYNSKQYDICKFEYPPDKYILFLVKGRVLTRYLQGCLDRYWGKLELSDPGAYYPVMYPAYRESLPEYVEKRKAKGEM